MKSGFTLIETFVAITILLIAVLGPMSLFAQAIADGIFAKNQVTAFYLAQEGVELTLNATYNNNRQNHNDSSVQWDSGLTGCGGPEGCAVFADQTGNADIRSCGGETRCGQIYLNGEIYDNGSSGGQKSLFRRVVIIEPVGGSDIKKVSSTVYWYNDLIPKSVTIDRYIYNLGEISGSSDF